MRQGVKLGGVCVRLVVFSDTHGNFRAAREVIERNPEVYTFFFLGDGEAEIDKLKIVYPEKQILNVAGNCDYNSMTPATDLYYAGKVRILYTHGHKLSVQYGVDELFNMTKQIGATIALFGHTHARYYEYRDGIYLLNPGSCSVPRDGLAPSYAFIDITPSGIMCNHAEL